MPVNWGLISTGMHPDLKIAPAIKAAADSRLLGAYSRDAARAEAFAKKHDIPRAYDSLDGLLGNPEIQAVFIASPNALHALHTQKAAAAGKHILVEKPMAVNVDEAVAMVKDCRRYGVKLGVGFHLRHHPGHRKARKLIAEGALGRIAMAQAQFFFPGPRGEMEAPPRTGLRKWWEEPEMVGGAYSIMGMGVHAIDLLHFLVGHPITEVAAITDGQKPERPLERIAAIAVRFQNEAVGTVCCGRRIPDSENDAMIYGIQGRIALRDTVKEALNGRLEVLTDAVKLQETYPTDLLTLYKLQIDDFNRAVLQGEEFDASGVDGLRVVQVASAVIESAKTGRAVKIEPLIM